MRWPLLLLILGACASEPPKTTGRLEIGGVRQQPLTDKEIEQRIQAQADQFRVCYGRERYNLNEDLSDFTFKVTVPNDGTPSRVVVQGQVKESQVLLAECLALTLSRVAYPPHVGPKITLLVPIKAPR